jgi:DinB family protein
LKENEMSATTKQTPKTQIETETISDNRSRRAAALADRIEQGAAGLAAFAEGLSEAEWLTPVSVTDRRSVGVIVHHVASVYPVEIEVAKTIASGHAITDVTWEVINEMNAKHATGQASNASEASTTKQATLDLLRRNSREAAAAVREFTDEQLDQAAPFSLSFGAPVTAQFVIEDHALRHSWHHLARIRKSDRPLRQSSIVQCLTFKVHAEMMHNVWHCASLRLTVVKVLTNFVTAIYSNGNSGRSTKWHETK